MELELKVTFNMSVVFNETGLEEAERFEKANSYNLDEDGSLKDLSPELLKEALYKFFMEYVGVGVYHQDYSGTRPMVCISSNEYIKKVVFDDPHVELYETEEV